nr:alpha/beta hydrolase-fold protein [uncultured Cohaesibacter sp.]
MKLISKAMAFGGEQRLYRHFSASTKTDMEVVVFLPMEALEGKLCPALLYLSGLTCSWREVTSEDLPQLHAAANGLIIIACDTSPKGESIADSASYDLGQLASIYLDAAHFPWSKNFQMESYLTKRASQFPCRFPAC